MRLDSSITKRGMQRTFGRRFISDLDGRHSPGSVDADYAEFARQNPGNPRARMSGDMPQVETSIGGWPKTGPLSFAWRDHLGGRHSGAWSVPGVLGVRYANNVKAGEIVVWDQMSQVDGSLCVTVRRPSSQHDIPAGVALRAVKSGDFGPLAVDGFHWVPFGNDANDSMEAGAQVRSLVGIDKGFPQGSHYGVSLAGACTEGAITGVSPLVGMTPVYRLVAESNGWGLIQILMHTWFIQGNNAWDPAANDTGVIDPTTLSSTPIWGQAQTFGLLDQLTHVERAGLASSTNKSIGTVSCPPTLTHLSLRVGARFHWDENYRGPLQFKHEPVPPNWIRAPLYLDKPTMAGEPASWVPAIPPPQPATTTPGEPTDPPNPDPEGPQPPPTPTPLQPKPPPVITPGGGPSLGPVGKPAPGAGGAGVPIEALGAAFAALAAEVEELKDILADVWDAIGYLQSQIDEILKKLAELEAAADIGQQKGCSAPPNNGGDGGAPAPGGNGGGGGGGSAPAGNQPPNSGVPAPQNGNGGPHAGGMYPGPRGPGQSPPSCAPANDPTIDDGVCLSTVDPDPFPNLGSGGGESVPGTVSPPGALIIGSPNSFIDCDGPAFNVYVDRAGQTWTTVPGMGASLVKLTWDPEAGSYYLDLWQTDYRPVTGASQSENFIASLAGTFGMTLNRHGMVTDLGEMSTHRAFKTPCRFATAAALPANSRSGNVLTASSNGALTVDGSTPAVADRIVVKNEVTGANNGVYVVTQVGNGGAPWILTRANDANATADITPGMLVAVTEGTANADTVWILTTNATITLNTTSLAFASIGGGGTPPGTDPGWSTTNADGTTKSIDCTTATFAQTKQVLANLIDVLKAYNLPAT